MHPVVDANTFRLRVETKINIIAKAVVWILAAVFWYAAFYALRTLDQIPQAWDFYIACGAAALAAWLVVEWPMKKLEERLPLFDE